MWGATITGDSEENVDALLKVAGTVKGDEYERFLEFLAQQIVHAGYYIKSSPTVDNVTKQIIEEQRLQLAELSQ